MRHVRRRGSRLPGTLIVLMTALLAAVLGGNGWLAGFGTPSALAAPSSPSGASLAAQDGVTISTMQALFFVWASGTPAVQRLAAGDCTRLRLAAQSCAQVSADVRTAWLNLAAQDPASTGRPNMRPNLAGRMHALNTLTAQLASTTHGQATALVATTLATMAQINQPQWARSQVTNGQALPAGTVLVWATSYSQSSLPGGLNSKRSAYAALPDAYLKYADWGQFASIPTIYQPYYAPTGSTAHWTVNVANAQGTVGVSNVPITDVGPWNEDDNWWDPNGSSTILPSSCPVASPPAFADATTNALVDGICPTGASGGNLRRVYYYLLYQHNGLPFFQASGYRPTGPFADGTNWPQALPQGCAEAAAASRNADGITCYSGATPYNASNGGWLRNATYNAGVTNQSSIDISPAVDKALGWTYPSSGLVEVTVSALP